MHPACTLAVIVATGNHSWLDATVAALLLVVADLAIRAAVRTSPTQGADHPAERDVALAGRVVNCPEAGCPGLDRPGLDRHRLDRPVLRTCREDSDRIAA